MRSNRTSLLLAAAFAFAVVIAGCIPEANRERGGDAGGDIGNWGHPVTMHGDEEPVQRIYYQTPSMGKGIERSGSAGAVSPES